MPSIAFRSTSANKQHNEDQATQQTGPKGEVSLSDLIRKWTEFKMDQSWKLKSSRSKFGTQKQHSLSIKSDLTEAILPEG